MSFIEGKKVLWNGFRGSVGSDLSFLLKDHCNLINFDPAKNIEADIFLHLAGASPVHSYEKVIQSNIIFLQDVIRFCDRNQIKNFVFFSSNSVYGSANQENIDEKHTLSTPDLYGLTKLVGEKMLESVDMNVLCLRFPAILTSKKNIHPHLFFRLLDKLITNQDVILTNSLKKFNLLVNPYDIFKFLLNNDFNKKFDILNFASSVEYTLLDLVVYLKEKLQSKSQIIQSSENLNHFSISVDKLMKDYDLALDAKKSIDYWTDLLFSNSPKHSTMMK